MRRSMLALGFAALAASIASADDAPATVPATVTAAKEEVAFHLDLTGAFDAKDAVEVAFKPQAWGEEVEVEEFRPPGPVAAGDLLIRFKTEKIDDLLRAAERDLGISRAAYATQLEDATRQLETTSAGLAKVQFDAKNAAEALERFEKIEMPLRLEEADHQLQGMRNWVTDQTEELTQLEKMYKADDLTEETEDIVLKRARRDLDRTRKSLDFMTRRDKTMREADLPREHEALKLEARRSGAERDRVVSVTSLQQAQSKLEIERAKANLEKQERDFAKLTADRALFELKAPAAGAAVPGILTRGKWQNADDVKRAMRKGGKFGPGTVLFTILKSEGARIVTSVNETQLSWIRPGQDAKVVATQAGVAPWTAKVAAVSPFTSSGEYAAELDPTDRPSGLIGMTCKIRVETGKRSAILVPQTAVEDGGFDKWVHVIGGDGKPARREVVLGQPYDERVEIASGLSVGDKILAAAPKK